MIIGIPKERKTLEKRVALTPYGAKELIELGHSVIIEQNAGAGSFFTDQQYRDAGCQICSTLEEVWTSSDMIVKVKEPHKDEYVFFREGLIIFDYLHLAGLPNVANELIKNKVTGIAYELVQTADKKLPLLEPMSEVAGKLSVQNGANFLLTQYDGRGVLLGGTKTVKPATVTIVGAGIAGTAALKVAYGMGANVNILDINQNRLDQLKSEYKGINCYLSNSENISNLAKESDLFISAVLIPGAKAPKILTTEQIKTMKSGAVIVDIAIDQGGSIENIKTTNLENPVYEEYGIIHYAVPNMPSQVARTSTMALTTVTLPYIKQIANKGIIKAIEDNSELKLALNTMNGEIVNDVVKNALAELEA